MGFEGVFRFGTFTRPGTFLMKKLFDLGFEASKDGYPWEKGPPGYDIEAEED